MGEQKQEETKSETQDNTEVEEKESLADTLYSEDKKDEETADEANKEEETKEEEISEDEISYDDFKLSEGAESVSEDAIALFKDSKLSQEDAQKFVDYGTKLQQEVIDGIRTQQEATQKEWSDIVDKELNAELPKAQDFVKKNCPDSFLSFLDESGLGNHPEMVKMMAKLSDFSSEDIITNEESSVEVKKKLSLAEAMYPGQ